jgi:Skp family chaperone for outer membrane proteins
MKDIMKFIREHWKWILIIMLALLIFFIALFAKNAIVNGVSGLLALIGVATERKRKQAEHDAKQQAIQDEIQNLEAENDRLDAENQALIQEQEQIEDSLERQSILRDKIKNMTYEQAREYMKTGRLP